MAYESGNYRGESDIAVTANPLHAAIDKLRETADKLTKQAGDMSQRLEAVLAFPTPEKNVASLAPPTPGDSPLEKMLNEHAARLETVSSMLGDISRRLRL